MERDVNLKYPRTLIISHNALSKVNNNGKTIETFFSSWPKENIAHLFLLPETEDTDFCKKSYCISDYDMLDNCFRIKNINAGFDVSKIKLCEHVTHYSMPTKFIYNKTRTKEKRSVVIEKIHSDAVNRKPLFGVIRDYIWKKYPKVLPSIYKWIEDFKPEAIFFQGSSAAYAYNLVESIIDYFNIPLFLQCTDDYTKPLYEKSVLSRVLTKQYLKVFTRCYKKAKAIYPISDLMAEEYSNLYGNDKCYVLSNSVDRKNNRKEYFFNPEANIVYAGNLGLNRSSQISELGLLIDEINREKHYNIQIVVFSGSKLNAKSLSELTKPKSVCFKGFISPEKLDDEVEKADFLLHVESFDEINKRITRLSISTKIGEYIASNRCIIAFGPEDVASISYIKKNHLGYVISDQSIVEKKRILLEMIQNKDIYNCYVANAMEEYSKRFTKEHITDTIFKSICNEVYHVPIIK